LPLEYSYRGSSGRGIPPAVTIASIITSSFVVG
jgi:hypothetical protein